MDRRQLARLLPGDRVILVPRIGGVIDVTRATIVYFGEALNDLREEGNLFGLSPYNLQVRVYDSPMRAGVWGSTPNMIVSAALLCEYSHALWIRCQRAQMAWVDATMGIIEASSTPLTATKKEDPAPAVNVIKALIVAKADLSLFSTETDRKAEGNGKEKGGGDTKIPIF